MKAAAQFWFFSIIFSLGTFHLVNLELMNSCDGIQSGTRMLQKIISSPLVYTALQCQDKCIRNSNCDAFNFKPGSINSYGLCELVELTSNRTLSPDSGYIFKAINRAAIRNEWLLPSCVACNSKRTCNREIHECEPSRCPCKKGYIDDGNGNCIVGCKDNAVLTGTNRAIEVPTVLKKRCTENTGGILQFQCSYVIILQSKKNVTIKFSKFSLGSGHKNHCSAAKQYLDIAFEDNKSTQRVCGDYGNSAVERRIFASKIYLNFYFEFYSTPCISINGTYELS